MCRTVSGLALAGLAGFGLSTSVFAQAPAAPPAAMPAAPPPAATPTIVDLTPVDLPSRGTTCSPIECVTCNNRSAGFSSSIEYLLVRVRRTGNDYAIVDPNNNFAPDGRIRDAGFPDSDGALRTSIGFRPRNSEWELVFTYMYLNTNDNSASTAPPGGVVHATLTRPGIVDRVGLAVANAGVNMNVFDFETARTFRVDDGFSFRLGMGTRFANMDNTLLASYFGGDANGAVTRTRNSFDAVGLTAGLQGDWIFGYGLRFFGRARGSVLMADFCNHTTETNDFGLTTNANVRESYLMTVPVLELASGLAWEYRNIRIALGYEIQNWFNVINSPTFVDDFAEGKIGRRQSDLGIEGFFVQFGVNF